jgi:hypothetical protein
VGHDNNNFTIPENHSAKDVIKVTFEELDDEKKRLVQANTDAFTKLYLESFSKTKSKVIQKS